MSAAAQKPQTLRPLQETAGPTDPGPAREARGRPQVWICTFDHHDATDIWACATEEIAYRELAGMCREFWEEARDVEDIFPAPVDGGLLGVQPPTDNRLAVERYFAVMNDADPGEWFLIAPFELIGAEGGDGR